MASSKLVCVFLHWPARLCRAGYGQGALISRHLRPVIGAKARLFNAAGWAEASLRCNTGWAK